MATIDRVNAEKERAASALGSIASALRHTGESLGEHSVAQSYVKRVAGGVERIRDYVRERELDELVDDVEELAHRQPALFLGGAFALGLLGARILKSSARRRVVREGEERLESTGWGDQPTHSTDRASYPQPPYPSQDDEYPLEHVGCPPPRRDRR